MLTLTESAREIVRELVDEEGAPEGSGLRISADEDADGEGLSLSIATEPFEGDAVVGDGTGRVFLEPMAAAMLDDQVLDAHRHEDHVHFSITPRDEAPGA